MRKQHWVLLAFLSLPLVAFHCNTGYPTIRNVLERPIEIPVLYRNGQLVSGEIPPGAKAWAPADAIDVDEIEVRADGELLFKLRKDELESLTSAFPAGARLMWEVHEDGMTPKLTPDRTN